APGTGPHAQLPAPAAGDAVAGAHGAAAGLRWGPGPGGAGPCGGRAPPGRSDEFGYLQWRSVVETGEPKPVDVDGGRSTGDDLRSEEPGRRTEGEALTTVTGVDRQPRDFRYLGDDRDVVGGG